MGQDSAPGAGAAATLERRTVGDRAADHLRNLILDGDLRAGDRVPQVEIAARLGISRTSLREALVVLEGEGWLTVERHRGAFVRAIDTRTVVDHYRIYGVLLGLTGALALERSGPGLVDDLSRARSDFLDAGDDAERSARAVAFNRLLLDAADSPRLRELLARLRALPLERYYGLVPSVVAQQRRAMDRIVDAVRAGDAAEVGDAYTALMAQAGDRVVAALRANGVIGDDPRPGGGPG